MSVTLVGGGFSPATNGAVYGQFLRDAATIAARREDDVAPVPRIAIITVREPQALVRHADDLKDALSAAGPFTPRLTTIAEGETVQADAFDDVDGILIGGGLTPAYLTAIAQHAERIRSLVESGVPYLGFSAGAAIAPDHALIGGWRLGGVEVSREDGSEDLDEVTIQPGLGLCDVTVDVHAVQWGNLSRMIAAIDAGMIDDGIAIDENTALVLETGALKAVGAGTVWLVSRADDGVNVRAVG
jgi:cyanophycinase